MLLTVLYLCYNVTRKLSGFPQGCGSVYTSVSGLKAHLGLCGRVWNRFTLTALLSFTSKYCNVSRRQGKLFS